MFSFRKPTNLPSEAEALPGRANPIPTADTHFVNGHPIRPPFPEGIETAIFGLGCFWGAERMFWTIPGVYSTAVGYAGGLTRNPTYEEVCSGRTGHNEVVMVAFDPKIVSYADLVRRFFEAHNPTQGMRQGNDVGTQYRSSIFGTEGQLAQARGLKTAYEPALRARGLGPITTEILPIPDFFYAEAYHQQYLARNPSGYCGLGGTGVSCPIDTSVAAE